MHTRITPPEAAAMLALALQGGHVGPEDTALVIHDLDRLDARAREAVAAFPPGTLHAVAVKANPLPPLLRRLAGLDPALGAEVASLPELELALEAGLPPGRIVFDSPAKTVAEIRHALALGVHLNADNFQELERIDAAVAEAGAPRGTVGLRVNPQVGAGAIAATSVAGAFSKFGLPLDQCRGQIVAAFAARPWLTGLHCHVGSQGCTLEQLVAAARAMVALAGAVRAAGGRVQAMDIGGGLPATCRDDDPKPTLADYAAALRRGCPGLFAGPHRLVTEFGRAIHAGAAFAAARVEYVKEYGGVRCVVTHLGADMFLRPCYNPADWHHDVAAATPDGVLKPGPATAQAIAGPLCFQGDFPSRRAAAAALEPGDWALLLDAGAYTMAMWSRYNSRPMPAVLGLSRGRLEVLRPRESVADVLRFWRGQG
ncbi:diaminopimelate decarboxylase [Desulfocurvus vexinensis]|uniref:diaminopimelate decarboxylase n=1 Tax=Desulfocurvus vexinensis TaxID=399548 RepID=UPI0004BC7CB4|nr:diaminopimelate decarboxylase [Desulfocurvus vexinensis]